MNIKRFFDQKIHLPQKSFGWIIGQQNRSLHGHYADGKSIRVFRLDPFFDLLRQPRFSRLPGRPDGEVMTAFVIHTNQRIQTLVNQIRAGYTKVTASIYRTIGMESAHRCFL